MRLLPRLLVLIALIAAAPLRAETKTLSLQLDGITRDIRLHVPEGLRGEVPLVLALHGLLERGQTMQTLVTHGRLDTFAERDGFVVAYPSAWGRVWNLGEGCGADCLRPKHDDLAFLDRTIAEARKHARIDPDRIFIAGFSMGGMIGLSYACQRPGVIRAIAIVASALPEMLAGACRAHPPEGVLAIHGTDDAVVPIEGGPALSGALSPMKLASWERTLALFTRANGCAGAPDEKRWDAKDDQTSVLRYGWYTCRRGAVEGYRVEGGGHRWPSGGPYMPITGRTTREIDGSAAVWGFFSRFR